MLRLRFADRPDFDLAVEPGDAETDAWALLRARADAHGRIALGDRESCRIDQIVEVELVQPEPIDGPGFERGLQDEDVSTALDENYDHPV
jgi:hypothetical protein